MDDTTLSNRVIIEPTRSWPSLHLGELWEYRDLIFFLAWRDISVRYKQTVLGAAWAIIQPFASMVVFSLIFGRLIGVPSEGLPYPIFSFAALLPWQMFSGAISNASNSVVGNANLISKVYFPRLAIPIASVLSPLVDFAIALVVLLGMMLYYRISFTWNALWLPMILLLALMTALGGGLWLSALNVQYRDVRHAVPFLLQFMLFASPVTYPSSLLPGRYQILYGLNPLVGIIEGFRWALLGRASAPGLQVAISALGTLALLASGLVYFKRMEATFADVV